MAAYIMNCVRNNLLKVDSMTDFRLQDWQKKDKFEDYDVDLTQFGICLTLFNSNDSSETGFCDPMLIGFLKLVSVTQCRLVSRTQR